MKLSQFMQDLMFETLDRLSKKYDPDLTGKKVCSILDVENEFKSAAYRLALEYLQEKENDKS